MQTIHTNTHKREDNSLGHMKAGGSGPNAKQSYLETKEQRLSGVVVEEGRVDVHLGFNMLMDAACEEDRETGLVCVCLCLCVWRWR